jgi:hypothetical protein
MFLLRIFAVSFAWAILVVVADAADATGPAAAGLKPGQRPGPYSAHVAVGPQRGQLQCFICETADRPAVIVFARRLSDPLGKLTRGIDQALVQHRAAELRAWVTLCGDDPQALDPQVVEWARQQAIRGVPIAIFADPHGPPAYRLADDAEITVLLAVKQKVVAAHAFRAGELKDEQIAAILRAVPPAP